MIICKALFHSVACFTGTGNSIIRDSTGQNSGIPRNWFSNCQDRSHWPSQALAAALNVMMLLCRSSAWRSEKCCKAVGHCLPTHAVIAWLLRASPGKRLASMDSGLLRASPGKRLASMDSGKNRGPPWLQKPYAVQSSCLEVSHYNHIGVYCVSIFLTILVKSCQVHRSTPTLFWGLLCGIAFRPKAHCWRQSHQLRWRRQENVARGLWQPSMFLRKHWSPSLRRWPRARYTDILWVWPPPGNSGIFPFCRDSILNM